MIAVIIQRIGDELTLLHHKCRTVQVSEKGRRLLPPGYFGVHVSTGEVLLAGIACFIGRGSEGVPDEAVEPFADGLIECRLEVSPERFVPVIANRSESFGCD